jgi:20S proteasome alpha/beta subunit
MVILDKNPLKVDPMAMKEIKVVETIKEGRRFTRCSESLPRVRLWPKGERMTLVVGLHCRKSIILGAEQEETTGIAAKRNVCKLKRYESDHWAIGFGGAGDGAIIDNAERRLAEWLESRERFTETNFPRQ